MPSHGYLEFDLRPLLMADVRVKLEFRKVLGRISDGLGLEDVSALKNLCYDSISERKREEINNGISLFNVLIERGLISAEKPQLLTELLDEIGRKDLSALVKSYVQKRSTHTLAPVAVADKLEFMHLKRISEEVGRDWKMLGRHLGLDEATLESIHQAHFSDLKEASYQTLLKWQMNTTAATPQVLKQALTDMRLMAIVHKYLDAV